MAKHRFEWLHQGEVVATIDRASCFFDDFIYESLDDYPDGSLVYYPMHNIERSKKAFDIYDAYLDDVRELFPSFNDWFGDLTAKGLYDNGINLRTNVTPYYVWLFVGQVLRQGCEWKCSLTRWDTFRKAGISAQDALFLQSAGLALRDGILVPHEYELGVFYTHNGFPYYPPSCSQLFNSGLRARLTTDDILDSCTFEMEGITAMCYDAAHEDLEHSDGLVDDYLEYSGKRYTDDWELEEVLDMMKQHREGNCL